MRALRAERSDIGMPGVLADRIPGFSFARKRIERLSDIGLLINTGSSAQRWRYTSVFWGSKFFLLKNISEICLLVEGLVWGFLGFFGLLRAFEGFLGVITRVINHDLGQ